VAPEPFFDDYIFVDFSAASAPTLGNDSIWIAHGSRADGRLRIGRPQNIATRRMVEADVRDRLTESVQARRRVLIGFDFPYAYPEGTATALRLDEDPRGDWHAIWAALAGKISDDSRNLNNRFDVASSLNAAAGPGHGPFWGCPPKARTPHLRPTRRPAAACWRYVEQRLRAAGRHPQESFKLLGAGSVGSQTMLGIPIVHRLSHDALLAPHSLVWPFEWNEEHAPSSDRRPLIVHAEIWPGAVELNASLHHVRDAAQVLTVLRWVATQDRSGELGAILDQPLRERPAVRREEGWILGVT
jgi:precorrin-8X/cobalt-precorrin-8 methylmutase